MLQLDKAQSPNVLERDAPEIISPGETYQLFVGFIRRQLPVIIIVTILAIVLGTIYAVTAQPTFTAQAQLIIDARKVQLFQQRSVFGDVPIDTAQVESQVEILKSENIASAVIKNLHLTEDPEFIGPDLGLLHVLLAPALSLFNSDSDQNLSEYELFRRAVSSFERRLSVHRVGLTYVIQIGFRSYNADRAAEIANAIADAYIVDELEAKYQSTRRASKWLQDRIKELRDQVSVAERAVVTFKTENNIVSTGGNDKRLVGEQQVAELSSQLVIARAHTAETKARLDRINAVLKTEESDASISATVSDTLKNEVVSKLRSQYLELAAREADWSARYGRNHLAVVNLRTQLREIRHSIFEELKRLGETYKSDYEIARQREVGVQSELTQAVIGSQETDAKTVTLRELQSSAQTYKTIYENFLQRYMEAVQQQSFPITEARLISAASRPPGKSSPKTLIILAITGLGGMVFGVGIGILRELSERVFRTNEQVEGLLLANCIALVPLLAGADKGKKINTKSLDKKSTFEKDALLGRSTSAGSNAKPDRLRTIVRTDQIHWTVRDEPFSRFAEAIRSIKLAVDLESQPSRVIGFTSSVPNEGKSTLAFSLAQLMAQVSERVILVDCDLRNPSLSRALTRNAKAGIFEVMAGKASLQETIWTDPSSKLEFLPIMVKSRMAHTSEVLRSTKAKDLFKQLRESYDYVVVDFSPLAPIVDVRAATHLVDSFVFVIEWGRTKIDVVERALSDAQSIYQNILGIVLNKVHMAKFNRYTNSGEDYYSNKHYVRYGYTE